MVGVFDLFKIGVGPSSSHTMGPMTAACRFASALQERSLLQQVTRVTVQLFGSLALTGKGHATDTAIMLGLCGHAPADIDPDGAALRVASIRAGEPLPLAGRHALHFEESRDIQWLRTQSLPQHPNALQLTALAGDAPVHQAIYYSVGGGFVVSEEERGAAPASTVTAAPLPFNNAAELLAIADAHQLTIAEVMMRNELATRSREQVEAGLDRICDAMIACIERGLHQSGILPGGLKVKRRAASLRQLLEERERSGQQDPLVALDWINAWALAVNEENAAGGKVVTAPTNGAAGVVPAVLRYYDRFLAGTRAGRHVFLLAAAAVGSLYKRNASISAAEVGCQGEIGVACSMAAAGLAAAQGASNAQVENAAEIGMEHNLGLTCDPVSGLVQIPCIERNATGAVKAVDAARLALIGDGVHHISLDQVIETMRRTGADMRESYKETSLGGLAVNVNVPEC
jgi:L-serine dehydratase